MITQLILQIHSEMKFENSFNEKMSFYSWKQKSSDFYSQVNFQHSDLLTSPLSPTNQPPSTPLEPVPYAFLRFDWRRGG